MSFSYNEVISIVTCRLPEEIYRPLYRPQGDPIRPSYYPTHEESYRPSYRPPTIEENYRPSYRPPVDDNYRPSYRPPSDENYRPSYRPSQEDTYRPSYRPWRTGEIQLGEDEGLEGLQVLDDDYIPSGGLDEEYIPVPEQLLEKQTSDDKDPYLESLMKRKKTDSRSDNWLQLESRGQLDNNISDEKIADNEKILPQIEENDIDEKPVVRVKDSGTVLFPE